MEKLILEAVNYVSKISKRKVTSDSIANYINKNGAHNIDYNSITETLEQMQRKGLINKLCRPTETSHITPTTSQSIPLQHKTPPDTDIHSCANINDSINKSIQSSTNKSLTATPFAQQTTTPRILSMGNSSLNTKLESLESKLCGKIMAMKSHFMDELRILKQENPDQTKRDYNIEEVTNLKNRIELLELENQLLKNDVSNKQKFIDTLLVHNAKLCNNIDVNAVNRINNDTVMKKQQPVKESQHSKTDEEYKELPQRGPNPNKDIDGNKHDDKENKENKKSKKDNLSRETDSKSVYILGDSIVKHVEGWKLKKSLGKNHNVYVRSFSGATVKCMKDYVKPCIRENNPDYVILHVGTNELKSESTPERTAKSVVDVGKNIRNDNRTISISGIVPRNDNFNNKAMEVNKELAKMCEKEKLLFVDNSNINPRTHLNGSKIHLNRNGYEKLGKNFLNFIKNNYT